MWVTEVTTVGFNPACDYDEIIKFIRENDMHEWVKTESCNCVAFTKTDSFYMRDKK